MTVFDGKHPRFYSIVPTSDGRWMVVFYSVDGVLTVMSEFPPGSQEDAQAVAASRNNSEMAQYAEESTYQMIALRKSRSAPEA